MRTDSVHLSDKAKSDCKKEIEKNHGKEYYNSRDFKTKSSGAQEAHEAIRPTEISRTPSSLTSVLDAGQLKLYTLIYNRTLASQMKDAKVEVTTFTFAPESAKSQEWITK